jgi:hypothetical protein
LTLEWQAQHLALMVTCDMQPWQILKSVCGLNGKQWATQAVTQFTTH